LIDNWSNSEYQRQKRREAEAAGLPSDSFKMMSVEQRNRINAAKAAEELKAEQERMKKYNEIAQNNLKKLQDSTLPPDHPEALQRQRCFEKVAKNKDVAATVERLKKKKKKGDEEE